MRPKKIIASIMLASFITLLAGCEKTDIHEIETIPKDIYQKTDPETFEVHRGDMQPTIKLKLSQNSLRYHTYSVDVDNLEFSELNISVGDYVKAGQVLVVFKSDDFQKKLEASREELEKDKLLLEHTKKLKSIYVDPNKPDDENNKALEERYNSSIAMLEDDIKLKNIEVAERQRDLDKCIIRAKEDGIITFVSNAIDNGIVVANTDLITQASGDVGFYTESKDDFEFEVGMVYKATSPTMEFDVEITRIEENQSGSKSLYFKPVSDDIVYVSTEKFEVIVPKEIIKDVVYVDEKVVYKTTDERNYVFVVDENGFKIPVYVEVDAVVEGMAIIKKGLEGNEEVAAR